ncbi:MAG: PEP-CTERM sorting domain-containing protein [Verrucomicrobiales bacterium]|nr:PEP-CTERM sorting domain-containing protein [Verrucomicrobiales bacterium]
MNQPSIRPTATRTLLRPVAVALSSPPFPALPLTAAVTALLLPAAVAENYASSVVQYLPGVGAAVGYDQPASVLGEPSRITPGDFGGPVDPFSGPWQSGQLVSLGAGGSLTIRFASPVFNSPGNPYGLDFSIFGSAAFMITNGDFTGGGITDGSMFGSAAGETRVSVSADGSTFYLLDPARAPIVDGLFPTDGGGDFTRPVNPSLTAADFSARGLAGIRELYAGSGGGTGYDLAWARDGSGQAVPLDHIEYVRIDVLSDRAEIDALVAVPEPGAGWLLGLGAGLWLLTRAQSRRP